MKTKRTPYTILAAILTLLAIGAAPLSAQDQPPAPAAPAAAAPAPAPPAPPPPKAVPLAGPAVALVNEVKIVVDDKAKSDGEVRFLFTPEGGEGKEIRVVVQKGMRKKDVCRDIAKEIAVALGDKYKVDQYDDDKVKVVGKNNAKLGFSIRAVGDRSERPVEVTPASGREVLRAGIPRGPIRGPSETSRSTER